VVEHVGAARHEQAVGRFGLPVRLDDLGVREQRAQRPLRCHRRRCPADAHLAHRARDRVGDPPQRDDVEDHATDEREIGDGEALRRVEHRGDVELLEQDGARAVQDPAQQVRHEDGNVRQRAETQADAVGGIAASPGTGQRRPEQVLVREHHALRRARRAGRVRDGRHRLRTRRARRTRLPCPTAAEHRGLSRQVRRDTDGEDLRERRGFARDPRSREISDQRARTRMTQQARDLLGRGPRRDRHGHGAEPPERIERRDDRRLVAGEHADGLPGADTMAGEPTCEVVRSIRQLAEGDAPAAEPETARTAATAGLQPQEGGNAGQERADGPGGCANLGHGPHE
jgi:hypothetical protein